MDSKLYWQLREAEALKHYVTEEKEYSKQIQQIYSDMLASINGQINEFYGKYATAEGITLAEAKKRVSKLDIAAYERKAEKYVKEKNFSKQANEEMRIYNATMKINRLEMLKANIGLEMISGHDELDKFMAGILKGRTMKELERQAGILGKTVLNNAKKADAIVNGSFKAAKVGDKSTFSDRIWQYQDLMREDLGRLLQTGLIQGKNPRAIAKDLKKYWYGNDPKTGGGATYCMERLMRTELARVQTEAQKQSFIRNGFDEYMYIANASCCADCQALNGKTFKVEKMMPGENASPLHPNCRCSVAAYEDGEEYEAWLDYLDKGGTTKAWNETGRAEWEAISNKMAASDNIKWPPKGKAISHKDYKEIMGYAREKGIDLSGFKEFDGDVKTVVNLIDDADSVAKYYPEIKNGRRKLTIELDQTMPNGDFARTDGHIIHINANAFRDTSVLAKEYNKLVDEGWFVKGTNYHAIVMHEIGHVVANKNNITNFIEIALECVDVKNQAELMLWLRANLSDYAGSFANGSEIISECFASVYGSEEPSKFALTFMEKCGIL